METSFLKDAIEYLLDQPAITEIQDEGSDHLAGAGKERKAMNKTAPTCLIFRKPCGCLALVSSVDPMVLKDSVREISECIKAEFQIDLVTAEYVRKTDWECAEHRKPKEPSLLDPGEKI